MSFILRVTPYLVLIPAKKNCLVSVLALCKITGFNLCCESTVDKKVKTNGPNHFRPYDRVKDRITNLSK